MDQTDELGLEDTRDFGGVYSELQWTPDERWHLVAGLRANDTAEDRSSRVVDATGTMLNSGNDRRTKLRLSGSAGATYALWHQERIF